MRCGPRDDVLNLGLKSVGHPGRFKVSAGALGNTPYPTLHEALAELLHFEWLPVEGRHITVSFQVARANGVSIESEIFLPVGSVSSSNSTPIGLGERVCRQTAGEGRRDEGVRMEVVETLRIIGFDVLEQAEGRAWRAKALRARKTAALRLETARMDVC